MGRSVIMDIAKVLLLFALVAIGTANQEQKPKPYDPRCKSNRPPHQAGPCTNKTFVYVASKRKCAWTCGKGSFKTRRECDGTCRTPVVCNWDRPFETCVPYFPVYYLQKWSGKCVLDSRGCRYYGNNFPTVGECQKTCKAG
uniref:Putative kunitz-bpti protein n=1 Tax=Amblyomma americanum TaxID=6943 RepID=A0A0C9S4G7_AMBAM